MDLSTTANALLGISDSTALPKAASTAAPSNFEGDIIVTEPINVVNIGINTNAIDSLPAPDAAEAVPALPPLNDRQVPAETLRLCNSNGSVKSTRAAPHCALRTSVAPMRLFDSCAKEVHDSAFARCSRSLSPRRLVSSPMVSIVAPSTTDVTRLPERLTSLL